MSTASQPPPVFPPLSRGARAVLLGLAGLFVLGVTVRFNGSSIGCLAGRNAAWRDIQLNDARSGVAWSTPKTIRSDEWLVWTPATLSQARQTPAFPTSNPALGPGKTPLLMSLPARDYTMLLRPQLWGYFLLPFAYGFAWSWCFKLGALFGGMFLLGWVLTGGRLGLALCGACGVEFSPFVQWWFSSPSMLPEMLAYWALGVVAAVALLRRTACGAAVVLALCLANLVLCCYPPFAIVLGWLGVALVAGFVWQHGLWARSGVVWLLAALALAAALVLPWVIECYGTLQVVAHTVYPGDRQCFGGGMSVARFLGGFFALGLDEKNCPRELGNICEAARTYPLWLLPLALGAASLLRRRADLAAALRRHGVAVCVSGYLLGLTLFALVPWPAWICRATLLSRTTEERAMLGIGVAGTLLVVVCLAERTDLPGFWRRRVLWGLGWAGGVLISYYARSPGCLF